MAPNNQILWLCVCVHIPESIHNFGNKDLDLLKNKLSLASSMNEINLLRKIGFC